MLGGKDWDQRLVDFVAEEFIRKFGVDPREEPNAARPAVARVRGRQADALGPHQGRRSPATTRATPCGSKSRAAVPGHDPATCSTAPRSPRGRRCKPPAWSGTTSTACCWSAARTPHAGGASRCCGSFRARSPTARSRPTRRWPTARRCTRGCSLAQHAGQAAVVPHPQRQLAQPGRRGDRRQDQPAAQRDPHSPQHAAAGRRPPRVQDAKGRARSRSWCRSSKGKALSPDDCSQLGKCSVRDLPPDLPAQTPIEVRFRYEENGRLTVNVQVEGTDSELQHEITRENSLTQEQLDSWRQYIAKTAS